MRNGRLGHKERTVLALFLLLIVLSGSKGALVLSMIWILLINFDKILKLKKNQKRIFVFLAAIIACLIGVYIYNNILINVYTYAYRMRGLSNLVDYLLQDLRNLFFGVSDIAYANTGFSYTTNMRQFLGWQSSVEMAYVNILIKNGLLGFIIYCFIFLHFYKESKYMVAENGIVLSLIAVMLVSGFVETYIASVHYVVGPVIYCLLNGLITQEKK